MPGTQHIEIDITKLQEDDWKRSYPTLYYAHDRAYALVVKQKEKGATDQTRQDNEALATALFQFFSSEEVDRFVKPKTREDLGNNGVRLLAYCWEGIWNAFEEGNRSHASKKLHEEYHLKALIICNVLKLRRSRLDPEDIFTIGDYIDFITPFLELEGIKHALQKLGDDDRFAAESAFLKKYTQFLPPIESRRLSKEMNTVVEEIESEIKKNNSGDKTYIALAVEELKSESKQGGLNTIEFSRYLCLRFRKDKQSPDAARPSDEEAFSMAQKRATELLKLFEGVKDLRGVPDGDDHYEWAKAVGMGKYVCLWFEQKRAFKKEGKYNDSSKVCQKWMDALISAWVAQEEI